MRTNNSLESTRWLMLFGILTALFIVATAPTEFLMNIFYRAAVASLWLVSSIGLVLTIFSPERFVSERVVGVNKKHR